MTHSVILLEHELDLVRDFMRSEAVRVGFEVGHVVVEVGHGRRDVLLEQLVKCLFWKHVEFAVLCVTRWQHVISVWRVCVRAVRWQVLLAWQISEIRGIFQFAADVGGPRLTVCATAVADAGVPSTSAISPKYSPAFRVPRPVPEFPSSEKSTRPCLIM